MSEIKPIETFYNGYRFRSRLEARWAVFFDMLEIKYEYEPEGYYADDGTYYLPDFFLPEFRCLFEVKRGGFLSDGIPNEEALESNDWKKIIAITEAIKIRNDDLGFDYIVLASGTPFECCIENKTDCGLVFNGIVGMVQYGNKEKNDMPSIFPITKKKDGLPVWGHMPICFERLTISGRRESIIFFGKKTCEDFEKSGHKCEIVPIGKRCMSLTSLMMGVIPRYRGEPLFVPENNGYVCIDIQTDDRSLIYSACLKARQARFEHGETPNTRRTT